MQNLRIYHPLYSQKLNNIVLVPFWQLILTLLQFILVVIMITPKFPMYGVDYFLMDKFLAEILFPSSVNCHIQYQGSGGTNKSNLMCYIPANQYNKGNIT